jgi:MYXO-CTERM domain-containing protein
MRTSLLLNASMATLPLFAFVLAACSAGAPPSDTKGSPENVAQTSSAVINGQLDTTHQAVVAIVLQSGSQGGLCSGTIVKTDPVSHIGWVVAAAHCVDLPPVFVLLGDDFSQASGVLRYDVIDYKADPRYGGAVGSPYDFAVLRIAGVDATTPTIPLASASDGLSVGTNVLSVGYGRTTLIASGAGTENTVRRHVAKQLGQVGQMIAYDMASSGICQGDSGGPVLVGSPGAEKVVGVHSYVQGDCNGTGVSSRVSFGLSFLSGELGSALPTEDCALCGKIVNSGNGTCAAATRNCLADKQCGGYYECLSSGASKASCLAKFPKAEGPFNAAANCVCTQACTTQCKGTFECVNTPKCGYKLPAGACSTCTEGACCDEALACASDGTCYVCLKTNDAAPECATNAARKAMATCVASKCNTECAGSGLTTGADPVADAGPDPAAPAAPGAGSTTTTTSGCSVTRTSPPSAPSFALVAVAVGALLVRRRHPREAAGRAR